MAKQVPDRYIPRGVSAEQQASIYAEGKQAFLEGFRRSSNPFAGTNTALAAIWWNGWDTGEEESKDILTARKKP
jgi:hypothetical protein